MKPVSLFVAIASGRDAKWPFPARLANLMVALSRSLPSGSRLNLQVGLMHDTAQTRRRLVSAAREWDASHILFLDDDMDFPHDAGLRLLSHEKEIVAANYTSRGFPVTPLSMKGAHRVSSRERAGLERVDMVPTGVMLIDMRVFERIEKPYFLAPPATSDSDAGISDDVYFCRKATAAGCEVWIDHDLSKQVRHVGDMAFGHHMVESAEIRSTADLAKEALRCA